MSTLERCVRHQHVLAGCGLKHMRCLMCNKLLSLDGSVSRDLCECRQGHVQKRRKLSKKAGTLLRQKFLGKRGFMLLQILWFRLKKQTGFIVVSPGNIRSKLQEWNLARPESVEGFLF